MKHPSSIALLLIALPLSGCATQFGALFSGGRANVSATVRTDPAVATAASVLAAGVALAASTSADSHTEAQARVHTPPIRVGGDSGGEPAGVGVPVAAQGTAGAPGAVTARATTSSTGNGSGASASTVPLGAGGSMRARTTVSGGASQGTGATGGGASVTMGEVTGVGVELVSTQSDGEVFAGGGITLRNAPAVTGLRVIEGSLAVHGESGSALATANGGASGHARGDGAFTVQSGIVLLGAPDGRRWRARVDGGELRCATEGTPAVGGRTVFVPSSGALDVTVIAEGGADLSLAVGTALPTHARATVDVAASARTTALSARTVTALNRLLDGVPRESPDALRLASAVSLVMDQAQTADPRFYDTPIVGRSVVLVVDVSYSMGDLDPGATDLPLGRSALPRKLDVARAELVKVLASIPSGVAVSVVAFSSGVQTLWATPRVMDDSSLVQAIDWVANLRPEDETEPLTALNTAIGMNPEQIVLLSDGRPSYRAPVADAVLSLTASFSASIRLDVVGIGADQDTELLTALASRGHGTLRQR